MKVSPGKSLALAAAIVIIVVAAGCDLLDPSPGSPGPSGSNPASPNTTVSLQIGARLFADNCARCHGDSAQGTTVGINIQGLTGIAGIVRSGKPPMPPFASLSDADIQSIGLFLSSFSAGIDSLRGAPLFAALCARCHGDSAQGIVGKGPGLQLETGIAGVVRSGRGDMPAFPRLTDQQIASLEQFFATVPFERTGRNLYVRYCERCHGADAGGSGHAPDIRGKSVRDLNEAIREGEGGMPRFPQLSGTDVQRIHDYILTL